jgi:hypothetical protein
LKNGGGSDSFAERGRNEWGRPSYDGRMKERSRFFGRAEPRIARWLGHGALVALVFAGASAATAQVEMSATGVPVGAVFEGQIVDSITGDPIEGVLVRMDTGGETFTDVRGEFRFVGLPQGRRLFALLTADCRITWAEITVVEGIPRRERYPLPPAFGAVADAAAEAEAKRKSTGGRVLTQRELDETQANSVLELIRQMAPNMVAPMPGEPGSVSSLRSGRGRSLGTTDPPVIVIAGLRTPGAEGTLATMRPSEIAELEVQPGAAAGWEYGSSGASGVIKITMRRGLPDGAEELKEPSRCVVPAFPRR